jgi:sec-independent protein translocase protein TatA
VGNLGPWEILIIAGVIILLFGAKKMPEMARSLGKSMRIMKAETKGMRNDDDPADATPVVPPAPQQLPQAQPQTPQVAPPIEQTQANKNIR